MNDLLVKCLRIKAGMIEMGEKIAWGSDSALMREAADVLERLAAPAVQGEPVAYLFPDEAGRTKIVLGKETAEHWCPPDESITPLYAAPQPAPAVQGEPVAWPLASKVDAGMGWTIDYRFLEQVEKVASQRTDFTTSMEAAEQVLIAAAELLDAYRQQGGR